MKYWLIYVDDVSSKEWTAYGLMGFKKEADARDYFTALNNTDNLWYHLKEVEQDDYRNYFLKIA